MLRLPLITLLVLGLTACAQPSAATPSTPAAAPPTNAPAAAPTPTLPRAVPATVPPTAGPTLAAAADAGTVRLAIDPSKSQASYKAREQLARASLPSDAIGTTKDVSGAIAIGQSGVLADGSHVTVKLDALTSDERRRDEFIKSNTLETSRYPSADFSPKAVRGLDWPLPTSGEAQFQMDGDLSVHGTTKPATWDVHARFAPDSVTGSASTTVTLDQFGMQTPHVFTVLSIENNVGLEIDFTAAR